MVETGQNQEKIFLLSDVQFLHATRYIELEHTVTKYLYMVTILSFLEAAKVVYLTLTDPNIGQKKKKKYLTEIGLHEVFLEAVPATLILVLILVVAEGAGSQCWKI